MTRKTKELDHEKLVTVFLGPLSDRHWLYLYMEIVYYSGRWVGELGRIYFMVIVSMLSRYVHGRAICNRYFMSLLLSEAS
jgi:hypothetical protein